MQTKRRLHREDEGARSNLSFPVPGLFGSGQLGDLVFQFLANFEFDDGTGRNRYILVRVLGVAAHFGLYFLYLEGAEVADHNTVSFCKSAGDNVHGTLYDVEHFNLSEVRFGADLC